VGEPPCDALEAELALDLVEGELAAELPAHLRAFARAHAENRAAPAAPLVARLASTLDTAFRALAHDVLVDRALALLRLVAPIVIEDDPAVTRARSEAPSWPGLAALATARDAIAQTRYGRGAIALLHRLHGFGDELPGSPTDRRSANGSTGDTHAALGPPIDGWHTPDASLDHGAIVDAWQAISARLGVDGNLRIDRAPRVRPRAFVIEPSVEVVVVVPDVVDSPATRFAVLHELGHAACAFALPAGTPRVLDEAAASYVARLIEPGGWLPPRWESPLAAAARRRRVAIAAMLDSIERDLPALHDVPGATPPWALWHDPGAQAAYVAAEAIADRLVADLGVAPPRAQFKRALELERARIDRRARV
jgi:hypothetical protein